MKSSKRTSVNLNRNTVDMAPPASSSIWSKMLSSKWVWMAICLTVAVFFVLVKLGFWQLERGNQKQQLEQVILARANAPYTEMSAVLAVNDWREQNVNGMKVKVLSLIHI